MLHLEPGEIVVRRFPAVSFDVQRRNGVTEDLLAGEEPPIAGGTRRNRDWVESNLKKVDKATNGRVAYVYVPNTGQPGYTSFNRYYFAQQDKKGAIIDERFNGGGSAADYIIEVLQRDFDGYFNNVAGDRMPFTSPSAGIWGPKVMIINEMAGSGGDLMPYMFRRRKIGPLVGKRTWGGLVHTADTPPFIDGGSMIAPRGGFITREGEWAIENLGVRTPVDEVQDRALAVAEQLAAGAQSAIRWTKHTLNHWYRQQSAILDASLAYEMIGFAGPDAREGLASHTEKRAPRFTGPTSE